MSSGIRSAPPDRATEPPGDLCPETSRVPWGLQWQVGGVSRIRCATPGCSDLTWLPPFPWGWVSGLATRGQFCGSSPVTPELPARRSQQQRSYQMLLSPQSPHPQLLSRVWGSCSGGRGQPLSPAECRLPCWANPAGGPPADFQSGSALRLGHLTARTAWRRGLQSGSAPGLKTRALHTEKAGRSQSLQGQALNYFTAGK